MNTEWDADLYLRFQKERTQPSIDLANRINKRNPERIVDIGCGPGNSTQVLRRKWPKAKITGIDNSEQMIDKASKDFPGENWIISDASSFSETDFDIVFSNAVLQWIPNHDRLLPHLLSLLRPEGVIAIQVPQNQNSILHKVLYETALDEPFREYTEKSKNILNYRTGEYYYNILTGKTRELYIWETSYYHVLPSHEDMITWYKSTGMRPFLSNLPSEELKKQMVDSILEKCVEYYKKQPDQRILFPFNRLFILGYV